MSSGKENEHEGAAMLGSENDRALPEADTYPGQSSGNVKNRKYLNEDCETEEDMDLLGGENDLESPGNLSQGQVSVGVKSTISGHSDNSRALLLEKSGTEKEVIVDQTLPIYEDDEEANVCKIGRFSPPCFLLCANIQMFVFFMCILIVVASALTTGYLNSVITTIEKR